MPQNTPDKILTVNDLVDCGKSITGFAGCIGWGRYKMFRKSDGNIFTLDLSSGIIDHDHDKIIGSKVTYIARDVAIAEFPTGKWGLYSLVSKEIAWDVTSKLAGLNYCANDLKDDKNIFIETSATHLTIARCGKPDIHAYCFAKKQWKEYKTPGICRHLELYGNKAYYILLNETDKLYCRDLSTDNISTVCNLAEKRFVFLQINKNVLFFGDSELMFFYDLELCKEIQKPREYSGMLIYSADMKRFYTIQDDGLYDGNEKILSQTYYTGYQSTFITNRYALVDSEYVTLFDIGTRTITQLPAAVVRYDEYNAFCMLTADKKTLLYYQNHSFPKKLGDFHRLSDRKKHEVKTLLTAYVAKHENIIQILPREILFMVFDFVCK